MRAVVLVGGFGTRLRPLTLTRPKQFVPVDNRPMLESVVGRLAGFGVTDVVLSLGYKPDVFRRAYPDNRCAGVRLSFAVEDEPLGTGGAIKFAAESAGIDDTFLVCNGDVLTDMDLGRLISLHRERDALATIALTRVDDPSRFGVVPTDDEDRVTEFVEKPPVGQAPTDLINAGTYVMEPDVLGRIPGDRAVSIERETFPSLVRTGRLFALHLEGYWFDAGTPSALLDVNRYLIDEELTSEGACLGDVAPGAVVERSMVGRGASIAAGATVIDSIVADGVVIGAGASVRDSIIGERARIGDGATLDALTVIGDDVEIEAGALLHGARVPEPDEG